MTQKGHATAELLGRRTSDILATWMEEQVASEIAREDLISEPELRKQSEQFLGELIDATRSGNLTDISAAEYDGCRNLLSEISTSRARQGFSPRETALFVLSLKYAWLKLLRDEYRDDPELLNREVRIVNQFIDSLSMLVFETFLKGREEVIRRQQDEILELSTPVIEIWDGVLVIPLVGTLDSSRTQVVMENLLQEIVSSGSEVAILDISGVPAMDTLTAQHLLKTITAARLMGAECLISGIRPGIAQTIVHLGIDLSEVITKASLAGALREALRMRGLAVMQAETREG